MYKTIKQPRVLSGYIYHQMNFGPKLSKFIDFWNCGLWPVIIFFYCSWISFLIIWHIPILPFWFKFLSLLENVSSSNSFFWVLYFFLESRTSIWLLLSRIAFAFRYPPNFSLLKNQNHSAFLRNPGIL